jgi:internalin A
MKKRDDVSPPHFPSTTGEEVIYYDDYNGRVTIGEGDALFETKWSGSSGSNIIAYNDSPSIRGIALAPSASKPQDVTPDIIANLNFTSRTRRPNEGQVLVIENINGRFLALKIIEVLAKSHGDAEDRMTINYTVVQPRAVGMSMSDAETAYKFAEAEIERVRANGLAMLDLSGNTYNALTKIPDSIAPLTALTTLRLSNTQVSDITPIAQLTALTTLSLAWTQVSDITLIAQLTALTRLFLNNTQISDITPIAQLTALTTLRLSNTHVSDITPIAPLTALTTLDLDNTQVSDLRPLIALRKLAEDPIGAGLLFENTIATRLEPRIAEIAGIRDPKNRAAELVAHLEDWEPPVEFDENGPAPSPLLDVKTTNDRLEIADSHPSETERDDQLKQVLHTRLKARNTDLVRLAGNQFFLLCAKARSLTTRLDDNFDDLDMLNIHLDVEELTRLKDRGAERDGDEPFPQEVADALADVVSIGPGLTLDNEAVELLEDRKRRFVANPQTADHQAAHDDFSTAVAQDAAAMGDRLRALETQVLKREDDSAGAAVQDAAHRNILILVGRLALAGVGCVVADVAVGIVSQPVTAFLMAKWPVIVEVAALYGPGFQTWFLSAMSGLAEFASLAANIQPRAIERQVKSAEYEV